jgi:hypothetical protein
MPVGQTAAADDALGIDPKLASMLLEPTNRADGISDASPVVFPARAE